MYRELHRVAVGAGWRDWMRRISAESALAHIYQPIDHRFAGAVIGAEYRRSANFVRIAKSQEIGRFGYGQRPLAQCARGFPQFVFERLFGWAVFRGASLDLECKNAGLGGDMAACCSGRSYHADAWRGKWR